MFLKQYADCPSTSLIGTALSWLSGFSRLVPASGGGVVATGASVGALVTGAASVGALVAGAASVGAFVAGAAVGAAVLGSWIASGCRVALSMQPVSVKDPP